MPTTAASLARLSQYNGRSVEALRAEFAGIGAEVIADFARYGVALDARTFGAYCAKLAAKDPGAARFGKPLACVAAAHAVSSMVGEEHAMTSEYYEGREEELSDALRGMYASFAETFAAA